MSLADALVDLYRSLIKNGVLILNLSAEPDNYNAPVSKAAELMDNYTFYRFSKICELFVSGKDIKEIECVFHNTRSGNTMVDILFEYYFDWYKKASNIRTSRYGKFSPLSRLRLKIISNERKLKRELEKMSEENSTQ